MKIKPITSFDFEEGLYYQLLDSDKYVKFLREDMDIFSPDEFLYSDFRVATFVVPRKQDGVYHTYIKSSSRNPHLYGYHPNQNDWEWNTSKAYQDSAVQDLFGNEKVVHWSYCYIDGDRHNPLIALTEHQPDDDYFGFAVLLQSTIDRIGLKQIRRKTFIRDASFECKLFTDVMRGEVFHWVKCDTYGDHLDESSGGSIIGREAVVEDAVRELGPLEDEIGLRHDELEENFNWRNPMIEREGEQ